MNCKELLSSIRPDMKLNKAFFLKVYGYEITYPGFRDVVIRALNEVGCSRAEEHYTRIVSEYEEKQNEKIKEVSERYLKECQNDYERFIKKHEVKEGDGISKQKTKLSKDNMTKQILNW